MLRTRKSENPAIETLSLGSKFCNRILPQDGQNPIISSVWTFKRTRTWSHASLLYIGYFSLNVENMKSEINPGRPFIRDLAFHFVLEIPDDALYYSSIIIHFELMIVFFC